MCGKEVRFKLNRIVPYHKMIKVPSIPAFRGRERVDATEPLTFPLREQHILESTSRDPNNCVYACALRNKADVSEATIGAKWAYVVFVKDPDRAHRYKLSKGDVRRVHAFDEDEQAVKASASWIKGQKVTLLPPPPTMRLGSRRGQSGSNVRKGKARSINRARPLRNLRTM